MLWRFVTNQRVTIFFRHLATFRSARLLFLILCLAGWTLSPQAVQAQRNQLGKSSQQTNDKHQGTTEPLGLIAQEHLQRRMSPKAKELSLKINQVLIEMGQLMEQTAEEDVDPGIIVKLRKLNAQYEQLSWQYEIHFGEIDLVDTESEEQLESGLAPGPQLTIQELQELTQR